jgi:hypothetical protein
MCTNATSSFGILQSRKAHYVSGMTIKVDESQFVGYKVNFIKPDEFNFDTSVVVVR